MRCVPERRTMLLVGGLNARSACLRSENMRCTPQSRLRGSQCTPWPAVHTELMYALSTLTFRDVL
eukprot:1157236-Pelagomonas_calceolata.AAC.4